MERVEENRKRYIYVNIRRKDESPSLREHQKWKRDWKGKIENERERIKKNYSSFSNPHYTEGNEGALSRVEPLGGEPRMPEV